LSAARFRATPRRTGLSESPVFPPEDLDRLFEAGADISRSAWDVQHLLVHLDIDYQNVDRAARPFVHPGDVFLKLEPVRAAVWALLQEFDLPMLMVKIASGLKRIRSDGWIMLELSCPDGPRSEASLPARWGRRSAFSCDVRVITGCFGRLPATEAVGFPSAQAIGRIAWRANAFSTRVSGSECLLQSRKVMAFRNREQAARRLVERLTRYRGLGAVVLAVPRGGVPIGRIVADELQAELDVVLVCKIAAPGNLGCTVAAVDESAQVTLTDYGRQHVPEEYVRREANRQVESLRQRRQRYTPLKAPVDLAGKVVIIVDDGISTGASMLAAIRAVRQKQPLRLVVAVPLACTDALLAIEREADEVVCLLPAVPLAAISGFYQEFLPVSDEEVAAALTTGRATGPAEPLTTPH
jgi:predicted phosphoribosyltransferase